MKKMIVALTILCASALYCMEESSYKSLPADLKQKIINTALTTSEHVGQAIAMIEKLSACHGICYDNLTDFTHLVHLLANKFDLPTAEIAIVCIEKGFAIPTAKAYNSLGYKLLGQLAQPGNNETKIIKLIKQGADINFSSPKGKTALHTAIIWLNSKGVKILLDAGAKPTNKLLSEAILRTRMCPNEDKPKIIEELIANAMEKQQ